LNRYFGTDGVRGRVGQSPMTVDFALRLASAAARVLAPGGGRVLIGKDTRVSGYMFESALEAGFVAAGVDVILAPTPHALEAATKATKTIPIVGVDFESDPVAKGWVATLARPGGNVTGFFLDIPEMSGKQLQLLKEVKPSLARVAVLGDARVNELQFRATEVAAQGAGLTL